MPVLKLCCFTYTPYKIKYASALLLFFSFCFFFFFLGGETSGVKAKCFSEQDKQRHDSLYQINGEQNYLAKLHLSRNEIQ